MIVEELAAKLGLEVEEIGFERAEHMLHSLHHGFLAFGAAVVSGLAVGAAALAKSVADAAVSANSLAQSTGLPLETVQKLGFAASTVGVEADEMAVALRHLAKTGVKDVEKGFIDLAEQFHDMPDGGKKVEIAMEKLGRGGARMIPLLNKGKEAITEIMDEAEELGIVFNEEDVIAGKEFKHALHMLEAAFRGLGYAIGRAVLPYAIKLMQFLEHGAVALNKLRHHTGALVQGLKALGLVLLSIKLAIWANSAAMISFSAASLTAYGEAIGAAIEAALAAYTAAAAWLAAAAPVVAIALLFAGLLLILEDVYQFFTGGDSLIGTFLDSVKKRFGDLPSFFKGVFEAIRMVNELIMAFVLTQIGKFVDTIKEKFSGILDPLSLHGKGLFEGMAEKFPGGAAMFDALNSDKDQGVFDRKYPNTFGGGAPSIPAGAAGGGAAGAQISAPANITVYAPAGASAKEIAAATVQAYDEHWNSKMREAHAGID